MVHKLHFRVTIITLFLGIIMQSSAFGQTTIDGFFYSPSLDQTRMVDIYLPPGYDANTDLYYPVIYYLHGWGGNQNFLSTISSYATQKINNGEIDPLIIVCASNYTAPFDGSMYMNSPVHGNYEDYMINDLISWLDTTYRTVPSRDYRTVMGHSMGGYGAFRYGTLHKDIFCGLAAHAAPANMEVIITQFQNQIKSENSGPPYSYNYGSTGNFTKMIFLGAGVWSPNLSTPQNYINPKVVEYPFDQQCNLIDTIFDKWDANQVTTLVHNLSTSDSMGILFGCGTSDELYFNIANNALKDTLDALNLDYEFYSHSGGHVLPTGFKNRALIFLDSLMLPPTMLSAPCDVPSDLLADNISQTSADFSWTENGDASSWEIVLGLTGMDPDDATPILVTDNPYSFTGLTANTDYEWYVRAVCDGDNYSEWAGPDAFTTLMNPCYDPSNLMADNITTTSTDLLCTSNGDETTWEIALDVTGFDIANATPVTVTTNPFNWNNLTPNTTYDWYVRANCAAGNYSNWVGPNTFTTENDTIIQTIQLIAGWNIHSFMVTPANADMMDIHAGLINNEHLVKIMDESGGFMQYITGYGWMNTIGDMQLTEGYYIKVDTVTEFDITGQLNDASTTIPLIAGWNIISYPISEGQDAISVVQPLIDSELLVKVIDESGGFIQEIPGLGWTNTIGNFEPGKGYYVKVEENTNLTINYPQGLNMLTGNTPAPETVLFKKAYSNNPYNPMNIFVKDINLEGIRVMEGDEIGVFDNDVCVGAAVITSNDGNLSAVIVAAMDDPITEETDGYTEGNPITFKYLNSDLKYPVELVAEDVSGSEQFKALGTYVVRLSSQLLAVAETDFINIEVSTYPNPVNDKMTVAYNIPEGYVYIGIINLNGARVKNVLNEYREEGNHFTTFDASGLTQGFYVLQIRVVTTEKVYSEFYKFVKL